MDQASVRFQLRLTGALGADGSLAAATLAFQVGPHTRQTRQQIFVLGQLHLEPAFLCLGTLGENVQDQAAAVQHLDPQQICQHTLLGRRQVVVKNNHGRAAVPAEFPHLLHLSLADKGPGIRGDTVLENRTHGLAAGGLHQGSQLLHGALVRVLLFFQHGGIQSHQHNTVTNLFRFPHKSIGSPYFL